MKIIVHSAIGPDAIRGSLGADDYSYYFVRRAFSDALAPFAEVVAVTDPATEVDPIHAAAEAAGEPCLFLSFAPPHKTVTGLRCPTVPVFAWEFGTIPNEVWDGDARNDWRAVFAGCRAAIALSSFTVRVVREAMGPDFPIVAIPAPVFDRFEAEARREVGETVILEIAGTVFDTDLIPACRTAPRWPPEPVPLLTPGPVAMLPVRATAAAEPPEPEPPEPGSLEPEFLEPGPPTEVAPPAGPVPAVLSPPAPVPPARPGLRRRAQITRFLALEWYRLAVRDLLPPPLRRLNALAGRLLHRGYRRVAGGARGVAVAVAAPMPSADESAMIDQAPPPLGPGPGPTEPREPAAAPPPVPSPVPRVPVPRVPVPRVPVRLGGVVFVSMFSPRDGRKNWFDIVTAFCWAFRDIPDATLVLKIVAGDHGYEPPLRHLLRELSPFRCRVVALHGFLEAADYRALIAAASFYVNASHCEGLCLPMIEFMSGGTPAIAPAHTAFEDYVAADNALVVDSGIEHNVWPDDRRDLFRTTRFRIDWHGLMLNYREGHRLATREPERHRALSRGAREAMRGFCAEARVSSALRDFLFAQVGMGAGMGAGTETGDAPAVLGRAA